MKTAEVERQNTYDVLIRNVLGSRYERVIITNLQIREYDLDNLNGQTHVEFDLTVTGRKFPCHVSVYGDGAVSCLFQGLAGPLGLRFRSLKRLSLNKFSTRVHAKTTKGGFRGIAADERIGVEISIRCDTRKLPVHFEHTSRSIVRSSICVVAQAFEMFINAESAMLVLHDSLANYRKRNRHDLVQSTSLEMGKLVELMHYSDIIETHRKESAVLK